MGKTAVSLTGGRQNSLWEGMQVFVEQYGYVLTEDDKEAALLVTGHLSGEERLVVERTGAGCDIYYREKAHFYRGLSLLFQHSGQEELRIEEKVNFESNGMMVDCSRNGVPRLNTLQQYIMWMAAFGMNRLYLYMEDTLEIEGYPFWGYLRGRYGKQEMRRCDSFARLFGITLIPCIQTLAHLRTILHLPAFAQYQDIDDILLLEDEKTRELLRALLTTVSECFSGGIVHLGMDEAAHLGRGKYMEQHGPEEGARLMKRHLTWLMEECRIRGLQPMIWSDMYLQLNFGTQSYYGVDRDAVPRGSENLSEEVTLCYWDYYHEEKEFYADYIRLHQKLGNPLVFAGGAWTWNGMAPCVSRALRMSCDALEACVETGTKDVFVTAWMDNGAETPLLTVLPALALYGEYGFGECPDSRRLEERFAFCLGKKLDQYRLLDAFDNPCYREYIKEEPLRCSDHNRFSLNPSKTFLYQDNLMGIYDKMYDGREMAGQYLSVAEKLEAVLDKEESMNEDDRRLFGYYRVLARLLSLKADVGIRIREAYKGGDRETIKEIARNDLGKITALAQELSWRREQIWMEEYKPFGYEVLDIRMAGVAQRAFSAAQRIEGFLSGRFVRLPELEEEILPYKTEEMMEGDLQRGLYLWERIVTAGNIDGV